MLYRLTFLLAILISTSSSAKPGKPPGISKAELKHFSILEKTRKLCGLSLSQGEHTNSLYLKGLPLGYRSLQITSDQFEFIRPSKLPDDFEAISISRNPKDSSHNIIPGLKARLILNTKTRTIVGITVHEYMGLSDDGKESWFYTPCGLTTFDQLRDLYPNCD